MPLAKENPGSTNIEHLDLSVIPEEIDPKNFMKKNGAGRPRHRDKPENKRHGWYSDAKKMEAACTYAVTGNARRVSELIKVPEGTIRAWKTTEWWHEVMSRIQQDQNDELDTKITKNIDKAVEAVQDRLEHGDYVYNAKTNELVRKPVNAKDLSIVAAVMVDKRQLLRGQPTSRVEKVSENEKLTRLAAEFKKFAQAKEIVSIAETIEEEQYEEADGRESSISL
jgi:hypothetical protein